MYHSVSLNTSDGITVTTEQLQSHFDYLKKRKYNVISFQDLFHYIDTKTTIPKRSIVLTFDDGYQNNCDLLFPLLAKYNFKATIFLPIKFLGRTNEWDNGKDKLMNEHTIQNTEGKLISYGLHSYSHKNYRHLSIAEVEEDVKLCVQGAIDKKIPYVNVFAYAYGGLPKDELAKEALANIFKQHSIRLALRIGNKVNSMPFKNPFELKRIDIKGTDTFFEFKTKVKKGRVKMF
jgi:peptidoglycan/xylan/chitin deacetylase (PgdA/CDA1 family)